jgi:uncharacterized protein YegP (UPF0339 family)
MAANQIEVEYLPHNGGWEFIINRSGIIARSSGYHTKADAKRAANDILKDLRSRNVIHVNKMPRKI